MLGKGEHLTWPCGKVKAPTSALKVLWEGMLGKGESLIHWPYSHCDGTCVYLDYEAEGLLVACDSAQKVLGSLTFEVVCVGLGVQAKELGSLARSGGGPALVAALHRHATEIGAQFLVTVPLDRGAAQFWARAGLTSQRLLGWNATSQRYRVVYRFG